MFVCRDNSSATVKPFNTNICEVKDKTTLVSVGENWIRLFNLLECRRNNVEIEGNNVIH